MGIQPHGHAELAGCSQPAFVSDDQFFNPAKRTAGSVSV
jgi:hypothetical protein